MKEFKSDSSQTQSTNSHSLYVSSLCLTDFPLYSNVNANEASDVETINNRNDTNCQDIEFQAEFY